ncbi:flavin-dependent oxidoreductase [Shimia abyssi]|uniref:2-polyprenyl-6-methoxyphenol hydroxylase-like FAD-dependent oxidoreductase n=1 Tax=Shimia abyssi TaxID=1662395 RepID=A0A2P8F732_9RHOB|nr:flavin-dependent oxidoreductase [Shimia abyssi]PSL17502.1 2-polyprenyl-6-methoxyphenol hydroxylase-like FAD-dependent oxidoreductase [Shimia abyssi]
MSTKPVLIAGGGIGGLSLALTLHQIGVPCTVFESVATLKPLGVGINLQPNAVRELFDLGIERAQMDRVGVPAREWALVGLNGNDIHSEPRGEMAGYNWPQYAVHRGKFHMLLYQTLLDRAGPSTVQLGARVTGYENTPDGVIAQITNADGTISTQSGALLIGADGIHSAVRAQMHPDQPPIHWGGVLMWRGTTRMKPLRTGSTFLGLGTSKNRMVIYPISHPDPDTGECDVNWIAEITVSPEEDWQKSGWFRQTTPSAFVHHFRDFTYDWLDAPAMISAADIAFENPMIDRDPIPTWQDGAVALMGDAAHAMYPTGSNGASQAIIDARTLAAAMLDHGVTQSALTAYNKKLCAPVSDLILRNRGAGPFGLLSMVETRCGGHFDDIDDVIPPDERAAFMAGYKAAAGFDIETLNAAPPLIKPSAIIGA